MERAGLFQLRLAADGVQLYVQLYAGRIVTGKRLRIGKTTSVPYAPYSSTVNTDLDLTYTYDTEGRMTTMKYHQGNKTTVTDAAGKWKTFTRDVWGNLIVVTEPDPANQPSGTVGTTYTYDVLNHLTLVTIPRSNGTQYRTFNYDAQFRLSSVRIRRTGR